MEYFTQIIKFIENTDPLGTVAIILALAALITTITPLLRLFLRKK